MKDKWMKNKGWKDEWMVWWNERDILVFLTEKLNTIIDCKLSEFQTF